MYLYYTYLNPLFSLSLSRSSTLSLSFPPSLSSTLFVPPFLSSSLSLSTLLYPLCLIQSLFIHKINFILHPSLSPSPISSLSIPLWPLPPYLSLSLPSASKSYPIPLPKFFFIEVFHLFSSSTPPFFFSLSLNSTLSPSQILLLSLSDIVFPLLFPSFSLTLLYLSLSLPSQLLTPFYT